MFELTPHCVDIAKLPEARMLISQSIRQLAEGEDCLSERSERVPQTIVISTMIASSSGVVRKVFAYFLPPKKYVAVRWRNSAS